MPVEDFNHLCVFMSLKSRIQKLEAKVKPQLNPIMVIAMNGAPSPEDVPLTEQARNKAREVLNVNTASVSGKTYRLKKIY